MKNLAFIILLSTSGCNLFETSNRPFENIDVDQGREADLGPTRVKSEIEKLCSDGQHNGTESDFDCGGRCRPCADNRSCLDNRDCISEFCGDGICGTKTTSCENEIQDGTETGIDCGGECVSCVILGGQWWQPAWNRRQDITFTTKRKTEKIPVLINLSEVAPIESEVRFAMNGVLLAKWTKQVPWPFGFYFRR